LKILSPRGPHGFFGESRRIMTNKINRIADAVKKTEMKILPAEAHPVFRSIDQFDLGISGDPRQVLYISTKVMGTIELLDDIYTSGHLPEEEIDAAVLGSGLGAFALPFAVFCEYLNLSRYFVTGFEISPILLANSQMIAQEQGINNVRFIKKDLTQLIREDFKQFNFIYIFKPFDVDLVDIMDNVYPRIEHGTLLLTRRCPREGVLRSGLFKYIDTPLEEYYGDEYHLYMRTGKEILLH